MSDAGTPAISDPGAVLVRAVQAAGLRVMPIPGASSVTAALSASGVLTTEMGNGVAGMAGGWFFAGFLSAKGRERQQALAALQAENRAVVLLEAPHRIVALCEALASQMGERHITLARELTKQFESIITIPAAEIILLGCSVQTAVVSLQFMRLCGFFSHTSKSFRKHLHPDR